MDSHGTNARGIGAGLAVTGKPCQAPAVRGWAVCRFHGARGGAPKGAQNGSYKHGLYMNDGTLRAGVEKIAGEIGLEYELEQIFYVKPVKFDEACVAAVRDGARAFGYEARGIVSGAGHDACYMSKVAPTAMVFVPCIDGISHNEVEDAKPEWITAGGNVLLRAIVEKAGRAD